MKESNNDPVAPLKILLADDDRDDRHFFERVLKGLPITTTLTTVNDGVKLMAHLLANINTLPDILFIDLNMPRKGGAACLSAIKASAKLKHIPVIIYSTHMHEKDAAMLYARGAHYYIKKTDMIELTRVLYRVLNILVVNNFVQPPEAKFVFH